MERKQLSVLKMGNEFAEGTWLTLGTWSEEFGAVGFTQWWAYELLCPSENEATRDRQWKSEHYLIFRCLW